MVTPRAPQDEGEPDGYSWEDERDDSIPPPTVPSGENGAPATSVSETVTAEPGVATEHDPDQDLGTDFETDPLDSNSTPASRRARLGRERRHHPDARRPAELPGGHQGRRRRRRWRQRRQPHDRRGAQGRRVRRGEHRRAVAAHQRRRREARHRPPDHARPRRGLRPRGRSVGRRGPPRRDRRGPQGRRHGVHHRGRGRWHRDRWCSCGRRGGPWPGCADDLHRDPPVQLRGPPPCRAGRRGHREAAREVSTRSS